jgi:hypothetical protein
MIYINAESASPELLITQLEALGFTIQAQRLAPAWEGRPPETLVIASTTDWGTLTQRGLMRLADEHEQDCIAVRFAVGVGLTIGTKPVAFNEEYFNVR